VEGEFYHGINTTQSAQFLAAAINSDTRTGTLGDLKASSFANQVGIRQSVTTGSAGDATTLSTASPATFALSGATFVDGGLENGAIRYAKDSRSAVLVYCDDTSTVNPATGLNATNITANSVDLNFTAPTPNVNGTDGYRVWIDNGEPWCPYEPFDEIQATGDTLGGLLPSTTYKIKIQTFDGKYNQAAFSNEIEITTLAS